MTLFSNLIDTYDHLVRDENAPDRGTLFFRHVSVQPSLIISLTPGGDFSGVREAAPHKPLLFPCTEASAGRSSGIAPHPLCDNLQYIAGNSAVLSGDLAAGLPEEDREFYDRIFRKMKEGFRAYRDLQEGWLSWLAGSGSGKCPAPEAVHKYVTSHDVIADIASVMDSAKSLLDRAAVISGAAPAERKKFRDEFAAFVKSSVYFEIPDLPEDQQASGAVTADSWNAYCDSLNDKSDLRLCPLTGKYAVPSSAYPRKIRHEADLARLISLGDSTGTAYTGRYAGPDDVTKISEEANQKIHKALSWLMRHNSTHFDTQYAAIWSPGFSGRIPSPLKRREYPPKPKDGEPAGEEDAARYAWPEKWPEEVSPESRICAVMIDSLSKGRVSVAMQEETDAGSYRRNLEKWQDDLKICLASPGSSHIPDIASLIPDLCGNNGGGSFHVLVLRAVLDGGKFPEDLMAKHLRKTMTDAARSDAQLEIRDAAAMIKACEIRNRGRRIGLMLDTELNDRSYLFGRLLAVADNIEGYVNMVTRENAPTAAMRYMRQFSVTPAKVWTKLEGVVIRSQRSLEYRPGTRIFLASRQKLLDEIMSRFDPEDFSSDEPLEPLFLLGYHHQRCSLLQKKEKEEGGQEDGAE